MISRIKAMLFTSDEPVIPEDNISAAAAALLIESAVLDGDFDSSERKVIAALLGTRFALSSEEVVDLIEDCEKAVNESVELYGITRILKDGLKHDERLEIIEMLWQVVYADGAMHDFEANLVRRVAGLLHVPDKEVGLARKRVADQLDISLSRA